MTLGEKLLILRRRNGIRQIDLARTINVSRQTINMWENNKRLPDANNIIALSKLFNISTDKLLIEEYV